MGTPRSVSRKLREMLGAEAATTMVDWLDELDERRDTLRLDLRADVAELRQEVAALRSDTRAEFAALREEIRVGLASADAKAAQRNADFMKWMLGFWITSFIGIVATILAAVRSR